MQQLNIIPNTEKGIVQWLQPVKDAVYNNAQSYLCCKWGKQGQLQKIKKLLAFT